LGALRPEIEHEMASLDWPELYDRCHAAGLQVTKEPDARGYGWARCPNGAAHAHGDADASLRLNVRTGMAKCMAHGCIEPANLNGLAGLMGVSIMDDDATVAPLHAAIRGSPWTTAAAIGSTPTLLELAEARGLPLGALTRFGVVPVRGGWAYPLDDQDPPGYYRVKALPGGKPKYRWEPKGAPARDLVYGLSRVNPLCMGLVVAAGEPDTWVLTHAGYQCVSFLAGEGAAPSANAWAKLKRAAPLLQEIALVYDNDEAGRRGARVVAQSAYEQGLDATIVGLPAYLPAKGDVTDLWLYCEGDAGSFERIFDALVLTGEVYEPSLDAPLAPAGAGRLGAGWLT
jgi:hypothetical protein